MCTTDVKDLMFASRIASSLAHRRRSSFRIASTIQARLMASRSANASASSSNFRLMLSSRVASSSLSFSTSSSISLRRSRMQDAANFAISSSARNSSNNPRHKSTYDISTSSDRRFISLHMVI
jgi:hypothetical protein